MLDKLRDLNFGNVDPIELFSDQFSYGHREILLKYSNMSPGLFLLGKLQHGVWGPGEPINFHCPRIRGRRAPFWVFSKADELSARSEGNSHVKAIGAPWLYLMSGVNPKRHVTQNPKYLIMPAHSTVNYVNSSSASEKHSRAQAFRQILGDVDATVCLHFNDFLDPDTRNAFIDTGYRITCVGVGANSTPFSPAANRVGFLLSLMRLMSEHTHLVNEGFSSSLMFAITMEMQIGLFPNTREKVRFGRQGSYSEVDSTRAKFDIQMEYLEQYMSKSIDGFYFDDSYLQISSRYLGAESLLTKLELNHLLMQHVSKGIEVIEEPW